MAKNTSETKKQTRRTRVRDLPREEKELSKDEQKKVKGGSGADWPSFGKARTQPELDEPNPSLSLEVGLS